ncbi:MAG: metallophosphoesterase, partial [Flavobacteriales bacterium]|nr:metallophosphoesterase [Flavobacteriales bacterium]
MQYRGISFITILLFFFCSAHAKSDKFRLIYTSDPSTQVTLGWNAISGANQRIYLDTIDHGQDTSSYWLSFKPDTVIEFKGMQNCFLQLKSLEPGKTFYVVFVDDDWVSGRFYFETLAKDLQRISIISGGDSRNHRQVRQRSNQLVSKLKPHAVAFGGDYTLIGTSEQWQNWFDDWQLTTSNDGRLTPIVPTRGNHERSNEILANLFFIKEPAFYKIEFARILNLYTLNSEVSIGGEQTNWLTKELVNDKSPWKLAQYHRPMRPHVSGKEEGFDQYQYWANLFYEHDVNVVIESDAHTVKSTYPVKPDLSGDEGFVIDTEGTVYLGEGTWGAPVRRNDDQKSWTRASGAFNQFKWFWIDKSKIEIRTIMTDLDADRVSELDISHRFTIPKGLLLWKSNGEELVLITDDSHQAPTIALSESFHQVGDS